MVEEHQGIRLPVELQQVPSRILEVHSQLHINVLYYGPMLSEHQPHDYRSTYELALSSSRVLSHVE